MDGVLSVLESLAASGPLTPGKMVELAASLGPTSQDIWFLWQA